MRKIVVVLVLATLAALAWFLFHRGGGDDPLDFVPADTPYAFANIEPIPAAITERYLALSAATIPQWRAQLARGVKALEAQDDAESARALRWLRAIDAELAQRTDLKSLVEGFGWSLQPKAAIYGVGLVPVARIELADPARLIALVERLETAAGEKLPRFAHAGVSAGWTLDIPEAPVRGVVAIVGRHAVATLLPAGGNAEAASELLGLARPKTSLAQSGGLAKLNREAGFLPYGSGFIDTARVLAQFRTPATPLEAAFLAALDIKKPQIPAECEADVKTVVASFPRAIAGYSRLDKDGVAALARLDTSSAIAQDLQTLRAPTPGLKAASTALASFSFSIKLGALPTLGNRIADGFDKNPWTCPALAQLNDSTKKLREAVNNPAVYAAAPMAHSFHLVLTRLAFDFDNEARPVDFAGKLLIGSDNPAGLAAMAKSFAPQIASLNLAPGAPPQPVPAELTQAISPEPVFAAQTTTALGVSVGQGEEADLPAFLEADPAAQPVLQIGYRGELMAGFSKLLRSIAEKSEPGPERDEMLAAAQALEQGYGDQIERVGMSVEFTGKGIELRQDVVLK